MIYQEPTHTMEYANPVNPHDISDVELLEFLVGFTSGSGRNHHQSSHHPQGRGFDSPQATHSCHSTPEKYYHSQYHHQQHNQYSQVTSPPRPYSMPSCQTPVGQDFQSNDQILRFREPGEIVDGDSEMESRSSNNCDDVSSTTSGAVSSRNDNVKV